MANLFYNMGRKDRRFGGLCGTAWPLMRLPELKFKDKDGIQIMKDYMASGSFARGKEEKAAVGLDGLCGQHQSERGCIAQDFRPV